MAGVPLSTTELSGEDASFSVSVSGGKAPYSFQWYYCNVNETTFTRCESATEWYERYRISNDGATSVLTVTEIGEYMQQDGARYYCVVTDAEGHSVTSDVATLYIRWKSPGTR